MTVDTTTALLDAVRNGLPFNKEGDRNAPVPISADVIRRLVLGLADDAKAAMVPTPAGVEIHHARIDGRVSLDRVVGVNGGPVPALEFHNCCLTQGFSGAHGKFSRLCFFDCTFGDPIPFDIDGRPVPTIDLTDAQVDSDLNMEGVRPAGIERDADVARDTRPYLWIRAVGARINGKLELSRCLLRAPPPRTKTPVCDEDEDALNFALATIRGDLWLLCNARCQGRFKLRAAHVEGDVWLRGASIEVGQDPAAPLEQAMFLQGARIDGFLAMDGGWDYSDESGTFRPFRCTGSINLRSAVIGRTLALEDAIIDGDIFARDLTVDDDMLLGGSIGGDVDLSGCRIAGSLEMADLNLTSTAERFSLRDGNIGRALRLAPGHPHYSLVKARRRDLDSLPGVELIETLWYHHQPGRSGSAELIRTRYRLVQAGFLRLGRRLWPLDGRAGIFERVLRSVGHKVNQETAEEYLRLHCAWTYGEHGLFRIESAGPPRPGRRPGVTSWLIDVRGLDGDVVRDVTFEVVARDDTVDVLRLGPANRVGAGKPDTTGPRFVGGLLLLPHCPEAVLKERIQRRNWVAGPTFHDMERILDRRSLIKLHNRLRSHVQHRTLLRGIVDLENLTCDMLDDQAGRAWGGDLQRIRMNHFTYRRATWASERALRKPTHRRFFSWVGRSVVDALWPGWAPLPRRWRKRPLHWEPWQSRRNWIYHQYPDAFGQPYVFRYKIDHESEYYPQPFEQAIRVARAEGRENIALNFEMLKQRIEWRMFNLRSRWWLGGLGFTAAYFWAYQHGGNPAASAVAWVATMAIMLWASSVHNLLKRPFPEQWVHHPLMEMLFAFPAIVLFFADGWDRRPLHFAFAVLIFIAIRSMSWLADLVSRIAFGYLRRPLRAIVTLTLTFLIGWWGVHIANDREHDMFVVDAEPVAGVVLRQRGHDLMGSETNAGQRDISCRPTLIEPLYALDVLIPLVDLREEARCEVRRLPKAPGHEPPNAETIRGLGKLWNAIPELTVRNHHFWAVMKVLYAIAGWFIVSLALLTFTRVNRTREDPIPESRAG